MAYTTPRTWVVGETVTSAQFNQQIRDNLNALWVGTLAGDMSYYTSSTARARLGIGANGSILKSTGSAPSWLAAGTAGQVLTISGGVPAWVTPTGTELVTKRQGGSSTVWATPGTTTYTPTGSKIQAGSVSITLVGSSNAVGTANITFPTAFTYAPLIFLSMSGSSSAGVWTQLEWLNVTNSTFTIYVCNNANTTYSPRTVNWMAVGV